MATVTELSFQDKVETILDGMDGNITELTRENQEFNNDDIKGEVRYHPDFIDTPDDYPYTVAGDTRDREDDHRPRVDEKVVKGLQRTVNREKPSVPAEKFDFDTNLGVVLDLNQDYFETLQCKVSVF